MTATLTTCPAWCTGEHTIGLDVHAGQEIHAVDLTRLGAFPDTWAVAAQVFSYGTAPEVAFTAGGTVVDVGRADTRKIAEQLREFAQHLDALADLAEKGARP